jgi:hypothetical protein
MSSLPGVAAPDALFAGLVDDAAMFPPGNAPVAEAVAAHLEHRQAWYADLIGPLVVPDQALRQAQGAWGEAMRAEPVEAQQPLAVSVINTGGAGGLLALARRDLPGVRVAAVESALRDLDDLAGNAARVASAAGELTEDIAVFVEIPYAPGWERAVAEVEAAGLLGKIRTGSPDDSGTPPYEQLAEQLSVLVEADLPFKATAGLHHARSTPGSDPQRPVQHGFLNLLAAVEALVEGASVADAADALRHVDPAAIAAWSDGTVARVRRRFRSFGCCGVLDPVGDLVALGLVEQPT